MFASSRPGDHRLIARLAISLAAILLVFGCLYAAPTWVAAATVPGPNGTSLTVTPTEIDNLTGVVTVQVTGSGYSTTKNGGVGVYLAFGPQPVGPRAGNAAFIDIGRYHNGGDGLGTLWINPGTPAGPNQAKLEADGTFDVSLAVRAVYTSNGTTYDGTTQALGVLTFAAHGTEASASDADSQFVFVPLTFEADEPATPPAAPAKPGIASAGTSSVTVTWTAPDDGGAPITAYTVTVRNGAGTGVAATETVGAVTSATVGGLTPDTSYNAVVAATNSEGPGQPSVASNVVRTDPTVVGAAFAGLRWKLSHQAWTSSSLSVHELADPATKEPDGFLFPPAAVGSYDAATGEAHATFAGSTSVGNVGQGGYRVWFAAPSVDIDADGNGSISADVSYRTSLTGPVTGPSRVVVVTFDADAADVDAEADHVVVQGPLAETFDSAFISYLPASLRGHFQPTMVAADPLKAPSPIAAGFDVPETDDPLSEVVVISTEVVETGALILSIDDPDVTLSAATLDAEGNLRSTGSLNPIRVVDLRSSNPGWDVTGQVSDFTGPGTEVIPGAGLSWTPQVLSSSPGQTVTAGDAGAGLEDGQVLGSAEAGQGRGTAVLGGGLILEVPSSTPPGTYQGRLTVTAI